MNPPPTHSIRNRVPALDRFGVAVEYFPRYRNTVPDPHGADVLLLSFISRGNGRHLMNDAVYKVSTGSLGITHYGEVHSIVTDKHGMDIYNIYLDPRTRPLPLMPAELRNIQQVLFSSREQFRHRFNRSIHLHFDDSAHLTHCVQILHHELQTPTAGSAEMINAALRMFLLACCRTALDQGIQPSLPEANALPAWVMTMCRQLDDTYAEHITLDGLADRFQLSKGYLCRAFKRHVGLSIFEYLTERRIQSAMQQLRSTDDKILAVALECGFGDLSHFNRVFKAKVGMPPTAYRRGG